MMTFGMGPGWKHDFWCVGFSIILMGSMLKKNFVLFCFLFIVEFYFILFFSKFFIYCCPGTLSGSNGGSRGFFPFIRCFPLPLSESHRGTPTGLTKTSCVDHVA